MGGAGVEEEGELELLFFAVFSARVFFFRRWGRGKRKGKGEGGFFRKQ